MRGMCSPPLQECIITHQRFIIIIAWTSQEMFKLYRASVAEPHYPLPGEGYHTHGETLISGVGRSLKVGGGGRGRHRAILINAIHFRSEGDL